MQTINVMLVDDHKLLLEGMKMLINGAEDIQVVAEAQNGQEALDILAERVNEIDVVLMDIQMPVMDGKEATKKIIEKYKDQVDVLMVTVEDSGEMIAETLETGASGYIIKKDTGSQVKNAIRTVYKNGGTYYGDDVKDVYFEYLLRRKSLENQQKKDLTPQELKVVELIISGLTTKEIGEQLFIARGTVETHSRNIKKKLDARNTAEVVREAIKNGLVDI